MSQKTLSFLWILTGILALALLAATLSLALQTRAQAEAGFSAVVTTAGRTPVYLRSGPSGVDRIITILEPGISVLVSQEEEREGRRWVYVESEQNAGWILATHIRLEEP